MDPIKVIFGINFSWQHCLHQKGLIRSLFIHIYGCKVLFFKDKH